MQDFEHEDKIERFLHSHGSPKGRVYVHVGCGGQTQVSGGDYTHICDPFWPCTSTYCCRCGGFAPLADVQWADTGETVSEYRSRMRAETPGLLKAWRYGLGFLVGGGIGALIGLLFLLLAQAPRNKMAAFTLVGGLIGAIVIYALETFILNRIFGIDYRRMR